MDNNYNNINNNAMNTMEIPKPNSNACMVTAVVKEGSEILGYQLNNSQIVSKKQAVNLARSGGIVNVGIAKNKGSEYLKSLPDNDKSNNFDDLPTITQ